MKQSTIPVAKLIMIHKWTKLYLIFL